MIIQEIKYMYSKFLTRMCFKMHISFSHSHILQASASPLGGASVVQTPPSATVSVVDTSSNSIVVHVICPICQRSVPHTATYQHFATCLQEVTVNILGICHP